MLVTWLLAASPIFVVIILMLGFRQGTATAGIAGWLTALAIAALRFGAGLEVLALAQGKALLFAGYVLYVTWMALLFYHTLKQGGVFDAISARLPGYVADHSLQTLLLAWAFGGFLEGIAGFGVPAAIVAPLLVAAGYTPVAAVVMASIGQSWAVTYGMLGNALLALATASHRQAADLAPASALLLGIVCLGCGLAVLWTIGGARAIRRSLGPYLVIGGVMSGVLYALACTPFFPLGALGAGFSGVVMAVIIGRLRRAEPAAQLATVAAPPPAAQNTMPLRLALAPYVLFFIIVILAQIIPPLNQALNAIVIQVQFPEMRTALGYTTPAGLGRTISIFGQTGALLAYATVLTLALFSWQRRFPEGLKGALRQIGLTTVKRAYPPTIGILAMVAMAITMEHAGMTLSLARGLSQAAGIAFPLVSPYIGALGAFMTGSNVNSNVIFASLQQTVAELLRINPVMVLAAQTSGGGVGGAFAPAKVILACSTVGLIGQEGKVLKTIMLYGIIILGVVGLFTLLLAAV